MKLVIAGYSAAPREEREYRDYYARLAEEDRIEGVELAFNGGGAEAEIALLRTIVPQRWMFVLTAIPLTMQAWQRDHRYGLASRDADGRAAALDDAAGLSAAVRAANEAAGRRAVLAVEIHSAPTASDDGAPDGGALAASLARIADMAWDGAAVLVEHCDAHVEGQAPAKGYLPLGDEIAALRNVGSAQFGISLNWGRSAIELRDADRVLDHVALARRAGRLRALTFSGAAATENRYGAAWEDKHLAFRDPPEAAYGEPASLLTLANARRAIEQAGELLFAATKVTWPAAPQAPLIRADAVAANFRALVGLVDAHAARKTESGMPKVVEG